MSRLNSKFCNGFLKPFVTGRANSVVFFGISKKDFININFQGINLAIYRIDKYLRSFFPLLNFSQLAVELDTIITNCNYIPK